jgi:hypothetical protein
MATRNEPSGRTRASTPAGIMTRPEESAGHLRVEVSRNMAGRERRMPPRVRSRPAARFCDEPRPPTYVLGMISAVQRTILRYPVRVDRVVVMTITLMSALIIFDGWERLRFADVAAIILGLDVLGDGELAGSRPLPVSRSPGVAAGLSGGRACRLVGLLGRPLGPRGGHGVGRHRGRPQPLSPRRRRCGRPGRR